MEILYVEFKVFIIEMMNLEDMMLVDIGDDVLFFVEDGFGLDLIDVFELVLVLKKKYGVVFEVNDIKICEYFCLVVMLVVLISESCG